MSVATPSATLENFIYWTSDEVKAEKRRTARKRYTDDEEDIVVEAEDSELYPVEEQKDEQKDEVITIDDDEDEAKGEGLGKGKGVEYKRPSVYVRLCEEMIETVLRNESYLFSENELKFLDALQQLSYDARFLFVRLLLRKPDKWFRVEALRYAAELGTEGRLEKAMEELCAYGRPIKSEPVLSQPSKSIKEKKFSIVASLSVKKEPIDSPLDITPKIKHMPVKDEPGVASGPSDLSLTRYSTPDPNDEHCSADSADNRIPSRYLTPDPNDEINHATRNVEPIYQFEELQLNRLANDDTTATLEELLECLNLEELRSIGKTMRLPKLTGNRASLITALMGTASTQLSLANFFTPIRSVTAPVVKSEIPSSPKKQIRLSKSFCAPGKKKNMPQTEMLKELVMDKLRKCIKLKGPVHLLFRRIHIIYFRSTEFPTSIMTPALMARFRKWNYSAYEHTRTPNVFPSRQALLSYEKALELEAQVDALLDGPVVATEEDKGKTPMSVASPSKVNDIRRSPRKLSEKENDAPRATSRSVAPEQPNPNDRDDSVIQTEVVEKKVTKKTPSAKRVLQVFERVYPRWMELVDTASDEKDKVKGLERFDEGWVLTRIIARGVDALAILYEYEREVEILEALLNQTRWRRGKRGTWYDRWALVLSTHLHKRVNNLTATQWKAKAREVLHRGLDDPLTHSVDKPTLGRRLARLEKSLAEELRRPSEHSQLKAKAETFEGVKIDKKAKGSTPSIADNFLLLKAASRTPPQRKIGKSAWLGANMEEVSVETLALHHYSLEFGYKGIHSEGRIVRTLFGIIFWDIIFAPVPGAFETPYQSAPLDIVHDSFYHAREKIIEERLIEIEYGRAEEIIRKVDSEHRARKTLCVGVRWDSYDVEMLVEIAKCLGGKAISVICRVFCEDYAKRTSGVPDLLIWHPEKNDAKFVEVKGPGDKLQENQKVWVDILLRNDIAVELCLVEARGAEKSAETTTKRKRKRTPRARDIKCSDDDREEEVPYVESEDEQQDDVACTRQVDKARPSKKRLKSATNGEIICLE